MVGNINERNFKAVFEQAEFVTPELAYKFIMEHGEEGMMRKPTSPKERRFNWPDYKTTKEGVCIQGGYENIYGFCRFYFTDFNVYAESFDMAGGWGPSFGDNFFQNFMLQELLKTDPAKAESYAQKRIKYFELLIKEENNSHAKKLDKLLKQKGEAEDFNEANITV